MSLQRFYRQPLDCDNHTFESTIDLRLRTNIDRLVRQIALTTNDTAEATEFQIAQILWRQLHCNSTPRPTNPRQDIAIGHWYIFLLNLIYDEVCRIDRLLPTYRRVELTKTNLFEAGRNIADRPKQLLLQGQQLPAIDSTIGYRQFLRSARLKVAWKVRDTINQLPGSKTYGHTSLGLVSGATPTRVENALIHHGFRPEDPDFQRLKLLHQVLLEIRLAIPERIDRWGDREFQLVATRFDRLASPLQLPTDTSPRQQLETLGQWIRNYLDPPSISLDAPISNHDEDDREIEELIPTPAQPDPTERSLAAIVIKQYLDLASPTHTQLLCYKYGLAIDKITLTDLGIELQVVYTSIRYHLKQIFQQLRDLLAQQLNEPPNLETLRLIEREIEIYYRELLESYLTLSIQTLAIIDRQHLRQTSLVGDDDNEQVERIHNLLIVNVGNNLRSLFKIDRFVPTGQARQLITNWIKTQLQQRPDRYL